MPRQRNPARGKAKEVYLKAKGKVVLKDIASKLGVLDSQVRKWKNLDKWDDELKGTLLKDKRNIKRNIDKGNVIKIKSLEAKKVKIIAESKLTEKQKFFCLYYIRNFNATQAYLKAFGCGYNTAAVEGCRSLMNPNIKAEIDKLKEIKKQSIMIGEDDIVELKMRIAFADITDFMEFGIFDVPTFSDEGLVKDKDGNLVMHKENGMLFKQSDVVDGTLISEIKTSRQGASLKLIDKQKAIDWLADYFGMNPINKYRKEFDNKKLQLEKERFAHQKKMDEFNNY